MGAGRRIERILLEIEPNAIPESAAGRVEATDAIQKYGTTAYPVRSPT
jgi:hypothetical protein